jgi:hypothetical protein
MGYFTGSNPPSSTNKVKGHLRVAFYFIGAFESSTQKKAFNIEGFYIS